MDQLPNLSERILAVYYTADHYPNTRLAKTNEQTNKHGVPEGKQA